MPKKVLQHFNYIEVYPDKFLNEYTQRYHKGDVNLQGMISISWKDFLQGYQLEEDGVNLGLHELAHALSMEIIKFKEHYPALFELIKPIYERAKKEVEGQMPRNLFLREYAFTNPHEYFACATEHYFEKGEELKKGYPSLYHDLDCFYRCSMFEV